MVSGSEEDSMGEMGWQGTKGERRCLLTRGHQILDLRVVREVGCANPFVLSDVSLEEESEAGERMDSGPGARAVAESL